MKIDKRPPSAVIHSFILTGAEWRRLMVSWGMLFQACVAWTIRSAICALVVMTLPVISKIHLIGGNHVTRRAKPLTVSIVSHASLVLAALWGQLNFFFSQLCSWVVWQHRSPSIDRPSTWNIQSFLLILIPSLQNLLTYDILWSMTSHSFLILSIFQIHCFHSNWPKQSQN